MQHPLGEYSEISGIVSADKRKVPSFVVEKTRGHIDEDARPHTFGSELSHVGENHCRTH